MLHLSACALLLPVAQISTQELGEQCVYRVERITKHSNDHRAGLKARMAGIAIDDPR